ncbi:glycoside hydrolase family 47 protein [Lepidopterella palustris CBS 459.81]|uniref:mannosyl-oligosaccharide 1,2-alpha-mannosidase n=1 Tax=Lepidopterella palustris CBS 459.81 TaxID=1314670 RepID=A0A8E2EEB4_9PEZI|nr:glycoside hydrolase family 47 protein [Lepidopterella palustris CBS 459.81]
MWGWEIFQAFEKYTVPGDGEGHSSLNHVNKIPPPRRDNMESSWPAIALEYLCLPFSPTDFAPAR